MHDSYRQALQLVEDRIVVLTARWHKPDLELIRKEMCMVLAGWFDIHTCRQPPGEAFASLTNTAFLPGMNFSETSARDVKHHIESDASCIDRQKWLDDEVFIFSAGMKHSASVTSHLLSQQPNLLAVHSTLLLPSNSRSEFSDHVNGFLERCASPLMTAALCANVPVIEPLLDYMESQTVSSSLQTLIERCLYHVAKSGNMQAARMFVRYHQSKCLPPLTFHYMDKDAFQSACGANNLEMAELMFSIVALDNVKMLDKALKHCCMIGVQRDMILYLLKQGADANCSPGRAFLDYESGPLQLSVRFGHTKISRLLIGLRARPGINFASCLFWPVYWQDLDMLDSLQDLFPDMGSIRWENDHDRYIDTVLTCASYEGCDRVIAYMLRKFPAIQNETQAQMAVVLASEISSTTTVGQLLDGGIVPSPLHAATALLEAANWGNVQLVGILLQAGADPERKFYCSERYSWEDDSQNIQSREMSTISMIRYYLEVLTYDHLMAKIVGRERRWNTDWRFYRTDRRKGMLGSANPSSPTARPKSELLNDYRTIMSLLQSTDSVTGVTTSGGSDWKSDSQVGCVWQVMQQF